MLGPAHSASGPAVFLGVVAASPIVRASVETGDGKLSIIAVVVGMVVAAGFALVPDFDGRGTATNSLGILGEGVMYLFRGLSTLALGVRTSKDTTDDPHRSLTHTLVFSIVMYAILKTLMMQSFAPIAAQIIIAICAVIGGYGIFHKFMKKEAGIIGVYGVMAVTLALSIIFIKYGIGPNISQVTSVIPIAALLGIWAHLAGDIITTKGIPLLWPIPIRRKMWYSLRPLGSTIEAANKIANSVMYWVSLAASAALLPYLIITF